METGNVFENLHEFWENLFIAMRLVIKIKVRLMLSRKPLIILKESQKPSGNSCKYLRVCG